MNEFTISITQGTCLTTSSILSNQIYKVKTFTEFQLVATTTRDNEANKTLQNNYALLPLSLFRF